MKRIQIFAFVLNMLLVNNASSQNNESSNIFLLSNKIPIDTPLIFGQGIISTDNFEFAITFNPEMNELFFTRRKPGENNRIYTMRLNDSIWTKPELAFFSTNYMDFEPHISPNGTKLYFGSRRPLDDEDKSSGMHQWYLVKNENNWSQPMILGKPFIDRFIMYITSSEKENLYFTSNEPGVKDDDGGIYYSIFQEGKYSSIRKMEEKINYGMWIAHPYIAPDESYIIFDGERESGFGNCDLYISFKNDSGEWTESQNLGPLINTEYCEMCSSVSPDGKYLFFHRGNDKGTGNIYWVDFQKLIAKINSN